MRPEAEAKRREVISLKDPMNEKATFREVFEAEESPLLRFAYGFVGQRETAEDLVQDAFLKLHGHWEEVEQPRAWLYRCVRNLALNHIRDHRRETELDPKHDTPGKDDVPEELLGRLEATGTLQLLLAEMELRTASSSLSNTAKASSINRSASAPASALAMSATNFTTYSRISRTRFAVSGSKAQRVNYSILTLHDYV